MLNLRSETRFLPQVQDVRYNQQNQVLQIKFSSGSVYQYTHVEPEIWESLQDTDSTGRFFHSQIKGYYSNQPVDDESLNADGISTTKIKQPNFQRPLLNPHSWGES